MTSEESTITAVYDYIVGDMSTYVTEFTPARSVDNFHSLPRFSHSGDISQLFSVNSSEVEDYALGLLFIACFVISFFTVWGCLLLIFKCIGPRHMGVFSGYPYREQSSNSTVGRTVFATSAMLVILFSILAVTQGLVKLQETADGIDATNTDVIKIHDEFIGISANLKQVSREATPVRDELVKFLQDDVCPLKPKSDTEQQVRQIGNSTLDAMVRLDDFIESELKNLNETLRTVMKASDRVDKALQKTKFTTGAAAGIMLPYFIVPALLLVTLYFGWYEIYAESYYCFTTYFLMPLFVLMVMFAYFVAGFAVLTAEANSDWCSTGPTNAPESTIDRILIKQGLLNNVNETFYYDMITFYTHQCRKPSPWGFLEGYHEDLTTAKEYLDLFTKSVIDITPNQLSQECGVDYNPTLQLLIQLQTYTQILTDSALRSMDLMSCPKIVPLYTSAIYESTCSQSITAEVWVFSCFIIISFLGMLMIMFRGAYYPIYYFDGKELDYSTGDASSEEPSDDGELADVFSGDDNEMYLEGDSMMEGDESATYDQGTAMSPTLSQALEEENDVYYYGADMESQEYDQATYEEDRRGVYGRRKSNSRGRRR